MNTNESASTVAVNTFAVNTVAGKTKNKNGKNMTRRRPNFFGNTLMKTNRNITRRSKVQEKLVKRLQRIVHEYAKAKQNNKINKQLIYMILATEIRNDFESIFPDDVESDILYIKHLIHTIKTLEKDDPFLSTFMETYRYTMKRVDEDLIREQVRELRKSHNKSVDELSNLFASKTSIVNKANVAVNLEDDSLMNLLKSLKL
jgi:hypothetical protein